MSLRGCLLSLLNGRGYVQIVVLDCAALLFAASCIKFIFSQYAGIGVNHSCCAKVYIQVY